MDKIGSVQGAQILKKGKKKQAKDELDRLKQAEKKKRRLEKALATSAAIRCELEKKKQKKIEEQQRLDEEGAAIAESVALHVLIGEDTDESCPFIVNNSKRYSPWIHYSNIDLFTGHQSFGKYPPGGLGWAADAYESAWKWNDRGVGQALPPGVHVRNLQSPYHEETSRGAEISVGLIAAEAVSSLQIAEEDSHDYSFNGQGATRVVFNRMLGSSNLGNELNLYKEF